MKKKTNKLLLVLGSLIGLLVICAVVILIANKNKIGDSLVDLIYDNRNHHVPCAQLFTEKEINSVLEEKTAEVDKIKSLGDGVSFNVWPLDEVGLKYCPGKADLEITYGAHATREKIEQFIGNDRFHGIPYNLRNW